MIQGLEYLAKTRIEAISVVKGTARGDESVVLAKSTALDEAEGTWEPVPRVTADAPKTLWKELKTKVVSGRNKGFEGELRTERATSKAHSQR